MRSLLTVFVFVLLSTAVFGGFVNPQKNSAISFKDMSADELKDRAVSLDLCSFCFDFMEETINELLEAILNGGVLGGCGTLCGTLTNQLEQVACNFLCDYVGIEAFVAAINDTDPDPIYVCQEIDLCPVVNTGKVKISGANVQPSKGAQGTTFNVELNYQVTNATGPGYLVINVICPDGGELSDGQFEEGQSTGLYSITWQLTATPSEQESFGPGTYIAQLAVCEGDCSSDHPYGGVYAATQTTFTISG